MYINAFRPSGKGPRKPREGVAQTPVRKVRSVTPNQTPPKRSATVVSDPGYDSYRRPSTQKTRVRGVLQIRVKMKHP